LKWAFLILALIAVLPLSHWMRRSRQNFRLVWIALGFMPFGIAASPNLDIAVIDWAGWPGFVKGALITAVDIIALAIFFALPQSRRSSRFKVPMILYFGFVALSALQAAVPMAALFYPWQLLRMYLIYLVVERGCALRGAVPCLFTGLAIGLSFQVLVTVYQRYGLGELQTSGVFAHQNMLGLLSNLIVLPLFALLLSGVTRWQTLVAPLAGCIIAVHTASRATVGLMAIGFVCVLAVSLLRRPTARKVCIAVAGAAVLVVLSPIAISSFQDRFSAQPLTEHYDERGAFTRSAWMIIEDNPFGIGANNFVALANSGGYYQRAGVTPRRGSRSTMVHNVYWLTAAELGFLGLLAFVILLFQPMLEGFRCGWRNRHDIRGDLLIGMSASLVIVYAHSYFEWIFLAAPVQYVFVMMLGVIAGTIEQMGTQKKSRV